MSELVDLFCSLAKIPSPSLHEDAVAEKIIAWFTENGIHAERDAYGNVYADVPATDPEKQSLLLSSHMDVVGDASPVNIVFSDGGKIIETDKTRTLGADDKAGVAVAMMTAKKIAAAENMKHGGLEIVFTRDEERDMTGIEHVEFNRLKSRYVLVADGDRLGDFQTAGAGMAKLYLSVTKTRGGHSGMDIGDPSRLNALKVLADILAAIPQGVYKTEDDAVVTSLNLGAVVGGGVKNEPSSETGAAFMKSLTYKAMANIINTDAFAIYTLRSSDVSVQEQLIGEIESVINRFREKCGDLAQIDFRAEILSYPFEKSNDTRLIGVAEKSAAASGVDLNTKPFHAMAETHLYAHQKNADGKTFVPYLVGVANITDMHSANERMDVVSFEKGGDFVFRLFQDFNA